MATRLKWLLLSVLAMTGCASHLGEQGKPAGILKPLGMTDSLETVKQTWGEPSWRWITDHGEKWCYVHLNPHADISESQCRQKAYVLTVDTKNGRFTCVEYYENGQKKPVPKKSLTEDLQEKLIAVPSTDLLDMMANN